MDAVAGSQVTDDVEPERAGERETGRRRSGEQRVRPVQALVVHPDALVGDRDDEAAVGLLSGDDDRSLGRREGGRVLEQLGEQVRDVGDRVAGDRDVALEPVERDAREVGDLRRGGPHDVEDGDRRCPTAGAARRPT